MSDANEQTASVEPTAEEVASAEELAGFEAAMNGNPLPKEEGSAGQSEVPEKPEDAQTISDTKPEEPAPTVTHSSASSVLTDEQVTKLLATATTVEELTKGLEKLRGDAFGKLGGLERLLKQTEQTVESGLDVTLTDDDFKDVETEVPMLTKPLQKLINKLVTTAKVKGRVTAPVDVEALQTQLSTTVDQKVQDVMSAAEKKFESRLLTILHPDWQQTVQDKMFHTWLEDEEKVQPGSKNRFLSSWDSQEIGGFLKRFHKHIEDSKKPEPKPKPKPVSQAASRTQRLLEALPPKASSETPRPKGPLTEEEAFELAAK